MELLPNDVREKLPKLYAQEQTDDKIFYVKYFTPDANWTWYACEGEQEENDFIFFGYVIGFEKEWGYFSLNELKAIRGPWNLPIERDLYFKPTPFSELKKQFV